MILALVKATLSEGCPQDDGVLAETGVKQRESVRRSVRRMGASVSRRDVKSRLLQCGQGTKPAKHVGPPVDDHPEGQKIEERCGL